MIPEISSPLANLMGAYYHQDWPDDGASLFEPLEEFLRDCTADRIARLEAELTQLLDQAAGDDVLLGRLQRLGASLSPQQVPQGARAFLSEVLARATAARLGTQQSP